MPIVLAAAKPNAIITDVGSVKAPIVDAAKGDPRFIGSHPMAGTERAGVDAANIDLFKDIYVPYRPVFSLKNPSDER